MKLRSLVDLFTRVLGRMKQQRKIQIQAVAGLVKVNLGCGLSVYKGWINIDGSFNAVIAAWPTALLRILYRLTGAKQYYSLTEYCRLLGDHHYIHHDLAYGIPLFDEVADCVYSSHFLEHLYGKDAAHLLLETYRVLKPGGILRICVPDLQYAVALYAQGDTKKMLDNYFFVDSDDSFYARHKYMYDYTMLHTLLQQAGFTDIQRRSYQQGAMPDTAHLDNRPEDTLFMEASKPSATKR